MAVDGEKQLFIVSFLSLSFPVCIDYLLSHDCSTQYSTVFKLLCVYLNQVVSATRRCVAGSTSCSNSSLANNNNRPYTGNTSTLRSLSPTSALHCSYNRNCPPHSACHPSLRYTMAVSRLTGPPPPRRTSKCRTYRPPASYNAN